MAWINQLQNPGDSERIPTVAIAETFIPMVQTEDESIQDKPLSNHPIRHARIIISKPYPMATPDIPKAQDPNYGSYITFHYVDRVTGERSTWSRPSSSSSSDREIVIRQRRDETTVWKIVRVGSRVRPGQHGPLRRSARLEEVYSGGSDRETSTHRTKRARHRGPDDGALAPTPSSQGERTTEIENQGNSPRGCEDRRGEGGSEGCTDAGTGDITRQVQVPATQYDVSQATAAHRWLALQLPTKDSAFSKTMWAYVYQIADISVATQWKDLMSEWRKKGTLRDLQRCDRSVTETEETAASEGRVWLEEGMDWDPKFVALYDRLKRTGIARALVTPQERLQMAALGRRYLELQDNSTSTAQGNEATRTPHRSIAKEEMFRWLYGREERAKRAYSTFTRDIKYWRRWLRVTEVLPRGTIGLFPTTLKKTFVEQKLLKEELDTWLDCIKLFRPEVIHLGTALEPILMDAIDGAAPPTSRMRLESWDGSYQGLRELGGDWFEAEGSVPLTPPNPSNNRSETEPIDWEMFPEDWLSDGIGLSSPPVNFV